MAGYVKGVHVGVCLGAWLREWRRTGMHGTKNSGKKGGCRRVGFQQHTRYLANPPAASPTLQANKTVPATNYADTIWIKRTALLDFRVSSGCNQAHKGQAAQRCKGARKVLQQGCCSRVYVYAPRQVAGSTLLQQPTASANKRPCACTTAPTSAPKS